MNNSQRKRKGTQAGKPRSQKRRRGAASSSVMTELTVPIELEESMVEVVDLTCESQEPVVVDLTHNDSVVIVEEQNSQGWNGARSSASIASCILSSDDEDSRDNNAYNRAGRLGDLEASLTRHRSSGGNVSCPICMDGYSEITQSGRLIVSTKCGHIFCSQCLRDALKNSTTCPTCRKKLTRTQYHPIYI